MKFTRFPQFALFNLSLLLIPIGFPVFAENLSPVNDSLLIIDSVEINSENVFELDSPAHNNFLFRLANSCHIVTRRSVVVRELLLRQGHPYDSALANESERNLRSLPYLLKTEIFMKRGGNGDNILVVNTSDRWTTTGGVSLHRSGGRSDLQIGLEENNFLGYGLFMSHDYFILEDDHNFYQFEIRDNRFLGRKLMTGFLYSDNPRSGRLVARAGKPFYSLKQQWAGQIDYARILRRNDYPLDSFIAARDRLRAQELHLLGIYRVGQPHMKYHFGLAYAYKDIRANDRKFMIADTNSQDLNLPPLAGDSIINYLEASIRFQQNNYHKYSRLNRFHKPEDINLGLDARISFGEAFLADNARYQYLQSRINYIFGWEEILIINAVSGEGWYSAGQRMRTVASASMKTYWKYRHNQTLVFGLRFRSDRLKNRSQTTYLDEDRGLRGYPLYHAGGEDRLIINIENRFFSDVEILTVGLGGVIFADIGNIWSRDSEILLRDTHSAIGIGLRLGTSRSSQAEIIRIDLAYAVSLQNWQISFGTGQFF
ncbi:MAG: hypothetical protein GY841_09325 [FCB group bacterium]|nr:hypothetical protein [FCB group bacterium]